MYIGSFEVSVKNKYSSGTSDLDKILRQEAPDSAYSIVTPNVILLHLTKTPFDTFDFFHYNGNIFKYPIIFKYNHISDSLNLTGQFSSFYLFFL